MKLGPGAGGSETILLVENEDAVREIARRFLERAGYTVLNADGPDHALGIAERHAGAIDLLLTDVGMPGMGGRALAEQLQGRYPGLRVLFMSGYTDESIMRDGVLHDEIVFLQKPFTPAAMASKVREALAQ